MISLKKIFQPVTVLYQIIDPFFIALSFKCKCKSLLSTFKNLFLITFYYGITFCLFLSVSILDRESAYELQGHLSPHSATQSPNATLLNPGHTSMQVSKSPPGQALESVFSIFSVGHLSSHSAMQRPDTSGLSGQTLYIRNN